MTQAFYIATGSYVLSLDYDDDHTEYQLYGKAYSVPTLFSSYQLAQYAIDECQNYVNCTENKLTYNDIKSFNYNF